jgi:hypothetical protein
MPDPAEPPGKRLLPVLGVLALLAVLAWFTAAFVGWRHAGLV